jgi:hypothetical protein
VTGAVSGLTVVPHSLTKRSLDLRSPARNVNSGSFCRFNSRPIQRQREEADVRFRVGRRGFILSTGLVVAPLLYASAQASLRIGWLSISPHPFVADFRERLRQLGYVEGENLVIEVTPDWTFQIFL